MYREQILGTWRSEYVYKMGKKERYDRESMTFYSNGKGKMRARTLFGRERDFIWAYSEVNDCFGIANHAGDGSLAMGMIEDGKLDITLPPGLVMVYSKES